MINKIIFALDTTDINQALDMPKKKSKERHQLVEKLIPDLPTGKLIREAILEII